MADWFGSARTNYFRVKNIDAFKAWAQAASLTVFEQDERFGVYSEDENGGWPTIIYGDDAADTEREFDLVHELAQHVAEGEIVVCIEAGAEKLRYITGNAIAFKASANGPDKISITLDDICDLALQKWGARPTEAAH